MDIQRTILLVALAVVSYMMVLQWNQDYGQAPVTAATTQSSSASQASSNQVTATKKAASNNEDLPVAVNEITQDPTLANTAVSDDLIYVQTDVLQLAIDPKGGDIVELKLSQYPRNASNPDIPLQLFENSTERVYVAQSGLVGADGPDASAKGRPLYSVTQQNFNLEDGHDQLNVDLSFQDNGVNYTKRFTLHRGLNLECSPREISQRKVECINDEAYQVNLTYLVDNQSDQEWQGNLFAQLKRDGQGDPSSTTATGTATYLGAAVWTPDEPYKKLSMSNMDDKKFNETVRGGWVAWLQHYFVTAWVADFEQTNQISTRKDSKGNYIVGYTAPALSVAPGQHAQATATLYAGPKIQSHLKALSPGLELTVDYGFLWFIAQPIFWLLSLIHSVLGNWGWSIVALTVLIKLAFFPLSAASYRSMARMRAVAPQMAALKEQYADDRQKLSQGMMELYKKEKINPLGGCLPILVQMPVFLSLYWVLLESVEMRQAPWILWITDLSSKDPYFILPIIMGLSMFVQQQLNPTPPDPMQAKVMKLLPIIFTFFFLWFPAGLVLYWVVNNLLSIAQQWYITRKIEKSMGAAKSS
ncbi:membrane protein insertase YidC [Denitrificimonas caeni]|uniref:Membrane protein insertase YidC n=1 Tax=Denitrificimonas caeni TaxID=521720 RepID=A0AAE9VP92_9GAMM|nr:membrane protein insertase YidC [Denitrificimonas caeni]WBE25643.1 membrane protein insertase YidC [Denitrificimonas caeni]